MDDYTPETSRQETNSYSVDVLGNPANITWPIRHLYERELLDYDASRDVIAFMRFDADPATNPVAAAIQSMRNDILSDIETNPTPVMRELLSRARWSNDDREAWEAELNSLVKDAVRAHPMFGNYRNALLDFPVGENITAEGIRREFDCNIMNAVMGMTIQQVEDELLPERSEPQDGFKYRSNYYIGIGYLGRPIGDGAGGGHAFLISSATGNILDQGHYVVPANENHRFQDYLSGVTIRSTQGPTRGLTYTPIHAPDGAERLLSTEFAQVLYSMHEATEINVPPLPSSVQTGNQSVDGAVNSLLRAIFGNER